MSDPSDQSRLELLIFELEGQRYGLPVADVREIVRAVPPVPLPGAPAVIEGVINLRGSVVPVLDVRRRVHLPPRPLSHTDHLVIARVSGRLLALRVDRALDLVQIAESDVDAVQGVAEGAQVARIARLPGDLVLLQDMRSLLSEAESAILAAAEGGRS